jgi:hypothetical protein
MKTVAISIIFYQAGILPLCILKNPLLCLPKFVSSILFRHPGDVENQNCSSFVNQVLQIRFILEHVDENSIVILDELGLGTSTNEGSVFCKSVITYLQQQVSCYIIFATHFTQEYDNITTIFCKRYNEHCFSLFNTDENYDMFNDSMKVVNYYFEDFLYITNDEQRPSKRFKII